MTFILKKAVVTAAVLSFSMILAAIPTDTARSAWFDNLQPTPRGGAMGGALTAGADDASAVYYNPAMLIHSESDYEAAFSYRSLWGQSFVKSAEGRFLLTVPALGNFKRIGGSIQTLSTSYEGNSLEEETWITLSNSFRVMGDIHSNLALGYSVNFYSVGFGESVTGEDLGSDWTVGFDAGVVAEVRTRTKIGAFVRNFNHPMLGEEYGRDLPRALTVGLSYIPYSGVSTNIDVEKAVDSDAVIHGGMEYAVTENVTIRAGLVNNPVSFSAGFKAHLSGISIEYSYVDHPVMPGSHYIGIGYAK